MTKPHYRMTAGGDILPAIRQVDGFQNIVANLGTSRDKSYGNTYAATLHSPTELLNAYRGSSVAKAIIDYPALDACREWREWQAESDEITKIEVEEKRLGIVPKVLSALKRARLFGGAAILIGDGSTNPEQPLNPKSIGIGGLKYLTVLDRRELGAEMMQMDPSLPGYGLPESYNITPTGGSAVRVHPSRLALFMGDELPDNAMSQSVHGWGESVLSAALEKVGHLDATAANVASLIFEAKVDVVRIANFTAGLREGGAEYERLMLRRFALAMTAKGINGALMLDKEEEYDQKSANFSTLPEIMDRFMQIVSAAAGIPMTRLFGMSPAGMNATGESDLRNYYDRVRQSQELSVTPALSVLDECLIRSALGNRPDDLHYNWRPLWQSSARERAENADKLMSAIEKLDRLGSVPMEAIAEAAVNALTESGAMPGLEGYVADAGGISQDDPGDEIDAGINHTDPEADQ